MDTMTARRNKKLKAAGERIARRSLKRALWRWQLYRGFNRLIGNTEAATLTFRDYIVMRTARKGRVTGLVSLRDFTSTFTLCEQAKATEEPLRKLIAQREDCMNIAINTYVASISAGNHPPPPVWSAGWRAKDKAQH